MTAMPKSQAAAEHAQTGLSVELGRETPLELDCGVSLGPFTLAYQTYGTLNAERSNAVLLCHALTGDQFVVGPHPLTGRPGWWELMVGPGKTFDTDRYFVICSNTLGGCMGTSGPKEINPATGRPWGLDFPVITIRDMVRAQAMLLDHLGIDQLFCVSGGSMGGMQALQWVESYPELCYTALPSGTEIWGPALWVRAALARTLGNLTALRQDNVVRMLAYSSIAQGGFILVPFAAAAVSSDPAVIQEAASATIVYVIIYAFMNLGAFGVVIAGARRTGSTMIDDWAGMWRYAPRLAVLGAMFFFSLAGIPPLAGWYAKFAMFLAILRPGNAWATALAVIAAVNAVIALVYYARIGKTMWMDHVPEGTDTAARPVSGSLALALGISAIFVVVAGILPFEFAGVFADLAKVVTTGI